jgi:hypothetical protein
VTEGSQRSDGEHEGDEGEGGRPSGGGGPGGQPGHPRPSRTDGYPHSGGSGGDRVSQAGGHGASSPGASSPGTRAQPAGNGREFVSYIAVHTEEDGERDPDGLAHADRLALETLAIKLILSRDPALEAMPPGNRGFDLIERGSDGEPKRWVEVKAMTVTLQERAVGLSSEQFEQGSARGEKLLAIRGRERARSRALADRQD